MEISKKLKVFMDIAKANAILARRFSSQGLGFGDIAVMYSISQAPGEKIRPVDLASQLGLTASGVTRLLIPLEKIGVIKRQTNERDGRVSFATLTTAGKRLLGESIESAEVICNDMVPSGSAKKLDELSDLLISIIGK